MPPSFVVAPCSSIPILRRFGCIVWTVSSGVEVLCIQQSFLSILTPVSS